MKDLLKLVSKACSRLTRSAARLGRKHIIYCHDVCRPLTAAPHLALNKLCFSVNTVVDWVIRYYEML